MWTLFIVFLSSGWNEPVQYKEVNRFETIEQCELRRRDLAAKSLDTPSTALNPQDLRTEVPVPMDVCLCVRLIGKKYEGKTL